MSIIPPEIALMMQDTFPMVWGFGMAVFLFWIALGPEAMIIGRARLANISKYMALIVKLNKTGRIELSLADQEGKALTSKTDKDAVNLVNSKPYRLGLIPIFFVADKYAGTFDPLVDIKPQPKASDLKVSINRGISKRMKEEDWTPMKVGMLGVLLIGMLLVGTFAMQVMQNNASITECHSSEKLLAGNLAACGERLKTCQLGIVATGATVS